MVRYRRYTVKGRCRRPALGPGAGVRGREETFILYLESMNRRTNVRIDVQFWWFPTHPASTQVFRLSVEEEVRFGVRSDPGSNLERPSEDGLICADDPTVGTTGPPGGRTSLSQRRRIEIRRSLLSTRSLYPRLSTHLPLLSGFCLRQTL